MAADNYSDVVQALAKQIVNTCMRLITANVKGLISSANIDASQITGDTSIFGGGGGSGSGGGTATSIDASNVIGLNQWIANAIGNSSIDVTQVVNFDENVGLIISRAQISAAQITELSSEVARIAQAYIDEAEIDTANIRDLEAEVARIATAVVGSATIDVANIDFANIDWAKIKNSVTDHAIITQGVGGQLYIQDLAVTEANMVSLTVGELVVKGSDGLFYSVSVDENNQVVATQKQIVNNDIANQTINADTKLIENSITARTLNVQDIFANSAIIKQVIAENLDVDTLFARQATINAINAMDIRGNQYLNLGVASYIDSADGQSKIQSAAESAFINMTDDSIAAKVMSSQQFTSSYASKSEIDELVGYRLEIISTSDILSSDITTTTLSVRIWHGNQNVTDDIPASRINWTRVSSDSTADRIWNNNHKGMKSFILGTTDVLYSATYNCEMIVEE